MGTKIAFNQIEGAAVNVKDFGAAGDGVTDDTAAIQKALDDGGSIFFPSGSYLLSSTLSITNKTGIRLTGENSEFVINSAAGYTNTGAAKTTDPIIYAYACTDMIIEGIKFNPDRAVFDAAFPSGEWGHAITLDACRDVVIRNNDLKSLRGDGVYAGYATNNNISIYNNYIHDNHRLGVSFVDIIGGYVRDNEIVGRDADGVYGNGIGMEPTNAGQYCNNIVIDGNNMPTASIGLFSRSTDEGKTNNISITNNTCGGIGIQGLDDGDIVGNKITRELNSTSTATLSAGLKVSATSTVGSRAGCNRRVVVQGNEINVSNSPGSPHPSPVGMLLEAVTDCMVANNIIKTDGSVSQGVRLTSGIRLNVAANTVQGFSNAIYSDNLFNYNDSSLVSKDDSEDIRFTDNTLFGRVRFKNNNDCRVTFDGNRVVQLDNSLLGSFWLNISDGDVTLTNNIITDDSNTSYGAVWATGNASTSLKASNNQITSTSYGVRMAVNINAIISSNSISAVTPVEFSGTGGNARGQYLESTQSPASGAWANVGTWGAGQVIYDETGASSGWRCTVAGTPGTWVAN